MKFVITAFQRSGTMMLSSFLNSHPDLTVYGEGKFSTLSKIKNGEGINLKYSQFEAEKIDEVLKDFKIIHLIRKNLFNLALSNVINLNKEKYKKPHHYFTIKEIHNHPDALKAKFFSSAPVLREKERQLMTIDASALKRLIDEIGRAHV